jgi:hypothetical protein
MAATAGGTTATRRQRQSQALINTLLIRRLLGFWALVDPERIDESVSAFTFAALPLIESAAQLSSREAGVYYGAFKKAELRVTGAVAVDLAPASININAVRRGIALNGAIKTKKRISRGVPLARAMRLSQVDVVDVATRAATDVGRQTLIGTVQRDPVAVGWSRATSGSPCAFCAMLAGRGPVYLSADSARFEKSPDFEAHAKCNCTVEASFDRGQPWPEGSVALGKRWSEATRGVSGDEALKVFRRSMEGRS